MAYTIEQFGADCREALKSDHPGPDGLERARKCVERACQDKEFVATHFGSDNLEQRKVIFEDKDLGFCILAHVFEGARTSPPHDHGPSWAIYGQAEGVTEMFDWRMVEAPKDGTPGKVEKVRSYDLEPGMAKAYDIGVLHSPKRDSTTRLIRIEGKNMDGVKRDAYEVA